MNNLLESVKETWAKLSRPMQIGIGVLVVGVFLSLFLLALFSRTEYLILFSGLDAEDAGAVVTALQERGTLYKLADGGTSVLVPKSDVLEARIALATSGVPTGGVVGFEIFDSTRLGETEADRQLRYQRALQGELTRTIRQINEVVDARVHIVLPKRSLFVQESQAATAAVSLQLKPGTQLSSGQVRAIANLVAASVEELTPDNVTITDSRGTLLNSPSILDLGGNVSDRFELQWAYEQQLERSIVAMLERIYGFGNVVARVNAVLDFARLEKYDETFSPINRTEGLVRSTQSLEESYTGTSTGAGGVPGVDSNVPGYVFLEEGGGTTQWQRSEGTTNYELNRSETWTTTLPGQVTNVAVSVWVNGDLTQSQLDSIEESVIRVTGLKLERGDSVYVASVPFEVDPFASDISLVEGEINILIYLIIGLGIILLLLVLFLILRKKRVEPEEVPVAASLDVVVDDDYELPEREISPEEQERLAIRKLIEKMAEEKPEEVASLMRTWMIDD